MNGTLRIAMLSEHANPLHLLGGEDSGGQNVYINELAWRLVRRGHGVDVFVRRDNTDVDQVVEVDGGYRVIHLDAGPPKFLLKDAFWPHMPAFRDAFSRFMIRDGSRHDILHGNFWMSGWAAAELSRRHDIPAVQIFHATGVTKRRHQGEDDTSPPDRIAVERHICRRVDRLICQCPAERDELIGEYNAPAGDITVIPSGVDIERFRPVDRQAARRRIGLNHDGFLVVYVGRMLPRKDVRNLVRGFAEFVANGAHDARLMLVGGNTPEPDPAATPEIGVLQRIAGELGVGDRLWFTGMRQPDELRNYYSAGDVAVTTPWYEPYGLTPLEAMACGRPVVGSAVGGIAFTVEHGKTGFLVPPRDRQSLAERLGWLRDNPASGQRMGTYARDRIEREFTWSATADQVTALYRDVIRRRVATTSALTHDIANRLVGSFDGSRNFDG